MTLQERQKREIDMLREEYHYCQIALIKAQRNFIDLNEESVRLSGAISAALRDPETYFKNIDKEE